MTAARTPSRGWRGGVRDRARPGDRQPGTGPAGGGPTRPPSRSRARHRARRAAACCGAPTTARRRTRRDPRADAAAGAARRAARAASSRRRRSSSPARRRVRRRRPTELGARARGVPPRRAARAIPPLQIRGERLLHIAADGSLYEAADAAGVLIDMPSSARTCSSTPDALLAAGPGAAWPPLRARGGAADAQPRPSRTGTRAGGHARGDGAAAGRRRLRHRSRRWPVRARPSPCRSSSPGGARSGRSSASAGTGRDPAGATWTALDADGQPVGAADWGDGVRRGRPTARRERRPGRAGRALRVEQRLSDAVPRRGGLDRRRRSHRPHPPAPARRRADSRRRPVARRRARRLRQRSGARRRGRLDVGVGVDSRPPTVARRGRPDRRGCRAAPAAGARAPAVRVGQRGLDRVAAGDAGAHRSRPPRRRRRARAVRDLRRRAAAGVAGRTSRPRSTARTSPPTTRRARRCTSARGRPRASRCSTGCSNARRAWSRAAARCIPTPRRDWHDIPRYESLDAALAAVSARWEALDDRRPCITGRRGRPVRGHRDLPRRGAGLAVWARRSRRRRRPAPAPRPHDPGGRARAARDSRRSRGRVVGTGGGHALPVDHARRHRPRRHRLDGHDGAARRARRRSSCAACSSPNCASPMSATALTSTSPGAKRPRWRSPEPGSWGSATASSTDPARPSSCRKGGPSWSGSPSAATCRCACSRRPR